MIFAVMVKGKQTMYKYIVGAIAGILVAIATNLTAPITIINFITAVFMGILKLFGTMIGCFIAYIIFVILGRCIPVVTSKAWENFCWAWEQINEYEDNDAEI